MASPTVDSEPAGGDPQQPRLLSAADAARLLRRQAGRRSRWAARGGALWGAGGLRILTAAAGGLALYAAYAPSTTWWAAIVGMALLGLALHGRSWKSGFGLGVVFGAGLFLPLLTWSNVYVGDVPWLGLAGMEALLVGPAGALAAAATRRLPGWPLWAGAAWVAGEMLRTVFPFGGFPWGGVAFSQPDGPLLPVAALLGESGLAFLTALAGFALAEGVRRGWAHRHALAAAARSTALLAPTVLLLAPFVIGLASNAVVQRGSGAPTRTVAVVQGNVPEPGLEFNAKRRAVLDNHAKETEKLAAAVQSGTAPRPDLVIWPENSSDIDPFRNTDAAAVIDGAVKSVGVPILVGAVVGAGRPGDLYNMGIVWDPVTGPGQTYTKRHPVPFGEYMPWRGFFRIFSDKVDLLQNQFLPGDRPGNLDVAGVPVGDVICFEVAYDDLVRDVVVGGARFLVVQTNNATFGWTHETYQQQAMSRVRAVEYGREVLIAATSGVSAVIRPDGTVQSSVPLFTAGYLVPTVPLISATTPGTVLGSPVQWVLTAACPLGLVVAALWARRRRRTSTAAAVTNRKDAAS